MEGYSNYQQVIDAIKAEYVNARNLKKIANTKKREAKISISFKNRKENEKTSLETKLTSVKNLLDSSLETSFNNLEEARFDALKSELSELKGKLAFIDADILRLEELHSVDPENIGSYPRAAKTPIESQSLTVLRNMLSVTIADAELVITNLYDGQDYAVIESATVPTQLTHTEQEVRYHYMHLLNVFSELFDKTKDELDNFVISIFFAGDAVNIFKDQLIMHSEELVTFKFQLATLLENEGPEAEINAKEQQIEDLKLIMLSKANDLKQIEVSIGSAMTTDKLVKLKRYAIDLNSFTQELRSYRMDNNGFLKNDFPLTELDIAYRSFELYSGVFEFMDSHLNPQSPRKLFQNGQMSEFGLLKQQITQAKEYYRSESRFRDNAHDYAYALNQPQQLFDCDERNNGNGTEYYNITDFRPEVPQETKDFYVNYSRQLHNATSNYMSERTNYDFYRNAIQQHIQDFNAIFDQQTINASALRSAKMQHLWLQEDRTKKGYGHYEGNNEQHIVLDNTRGAWFEAEAEYLSQFYTNRSKSNKFDLFESIFPQFYSDLSTLESIKTSAEVNYSSLNTTLEDLITSKHAAYDYLQTLTVGEADYVAALADYEAKSAAYDLAYADWVNKTDGPGGHEEAYAFLQTTLAGEADYQAAKADYDAKLLDYNSKVTEANILEDGILGSGWLYGLDGGVNGANAILQTTLAGEAEYQAALPEINEPSTPPLFTQAEVDRLIGLHTVYLAAQSDYDTKHTAWVSFWNDVVNPAADVKWAAYSLRDSLTPGHYVYLGAQSDYDTKLAAKDAYYSDVVAPAEVLKNDAYTFLQDLTDEDAAYQAALIDWNSKVYASNVYFNATFIPAQQAHQAAVDAISQHISSSWGSDLNLSYFGSTLKAFKDDKNYAVSQYQQLNDSFPTIEADFQTAKDVMTFVEPTPLEKRDAIRMIKDLDKLRMRKERLYSLTNRNIQFMPTIGGWIIDFALIVRGYTESYFDGLLQSVKNFMESNTLYSSKLVDKKKAEHEVNINRARLENHYKSIISDWNLNFYAQSDDIVSTTGCNSFAELQSQTDRFMNKIQNLNNTLFRIDNGTNFADRIIDEVNNGTPLA